eukprot:1627353-Heterocapsa_arctica.AAC.1
MALLAALKADAMKTRAALERMKSWKAWIQEAFEKGASKAHKFANGQNLLHPGKSLLMGNTSAHQVRSWKPGQISGRTYGRGTRNRRTRCSRTWWPSEQLHDSSSTAGRRSL